MNDKLFTINFKRLASWWLFTFWRTKSVLNLVSVLIFCIEDLYKSVMEERKGNLEKMNYNYQKFSLEKVLNRKHDRVAKRIKIIKAVQYEGVYIYTEAEDNQGSTPTPGGGIYNPKTKWLYGDTNPLYLRMEAELYSEYDFIVQIPVNSDNPDEPLLNIDQLKADIDFYKLPSKRYQIQTKAY
ncbi:hypothetical protein C1637_18595 [Chryseobacterium lactis]|uniref:Uncharacterized protein n=1 Tax=Chryseobacterium lactis TaxID=1241981 RepID=A0A3G6RJN3_CHRLC|nr:hypothetical protein [Chryseobacterium lactis]AZA84792.1 hypothetical protein EG342_24105 [Chryseobacterium lactis]AZB05181.1 hypothetical protein EG341_14985 [Chryseobacterium lactis]PNW12163.1 hypothetical protein C1637_18595 [Chryseobacterium lactis]